MATELDYLGLLAEESLRFAAAIRQAPGGTPVPSCPDWDADDLLWHLADVQWFWAEVVRSRADDPGPVESRKPPRPAGRAGLEEHFAAASSGLLDALTAAPATPVWTWYPPDRSVGFVRRRQAHEALIHRVDAELTAGARTPMNPALSADGVDEALRVMFGAVLDWGTFTPLELPEADVPGTAAQPLLRVRCTDTGQSWLADPGTFTGATPDGQESWTDQPALRVADADDGAPSLATLAAAAADLDCLLWNRRPAGPVERLGHPQVLAALDTIVSDGIQ